MNIVESIIYGLVSGVSEFMPVSSYGHQVLLRRIFGITNWNPVLDLIVHLALLLSVFLSCGASLSAYQREMKISRQHSRFRRTHGNIRRTYDLRFLFTAAIAMLGILLFSAFGRNTENNPLLVCLFFLINGTVLYVTDHLRHSNKDSRLMSGFDAILTGIFGGLSIFPGFSRVGMCLSASVGRGADKALGLNWALLLSIPALILLSLFDIIGIFQAIQISLSFGVVAGYLLAGIAAFLGSYFIIKFMRFVVVNTGFSGFACYCWGMGILTFILYLIS